MERSNLVIAGVLTACAALLVAVALAPPLPRGTIGEDEPLEPEVRITPTKPAPPSASSKAPAVADGPTRTLATFTWGGGKNQLGRARPREGSPEAPMAVAVDKAGTPHLLDQVNGRILALDAAGHIARELKAPRTGRDFAIADNGNLVVLDREAVTVLGPDGKAAGRFDVRDVPKVSGVVVDGDDVYVEREHRELVRLGDATGASDPERGVVPGRPTRDGKSFLLASITDGAHGTIALAAIAQDTDEKRFARELQLGMPVMKVLLLDSDASGRIYLAALGERLPPGRVSGELVATVDLLCLDGRDGKPLGRVELPANTSADEAVRELAVLDSGGVVYLVRTEGAAELRKADCK